MPRLIMFRSAPTALVAHPGAIDISPRRFAGRKLRETPPSPKVEANDEHPDLVDHYEVCDEVLVDDPLLQKAAGRGDGIILGVGMARTMAEAERLLMLDVAKRKAATPAPAAPSVEAGPSDPPPARGRSAAPSSEAAPSNKSTKVS